MSKIHLKVKNGKKQLAHPQYNSDLIDYDYMVMTVSRIVSDKTDTSTVRILGPVRSGPVLPVRESVPSYTDLFALNK